MVSGGLFFPCNPGGACEADCGACVTGDPPAQGAWTLDYIDPGNYLVCVEQIDTRISLSNNTFVGPLATPPVLPGPEECYSIGETAVAELDDPDDDTLLNIVGLGSTIDILLNTLPVLDPHEPNDTLLTAATLSDLPPRDTTGAILVDSDSDGITEDVDFYEFGVSAGDRVRIDIEAKELGSVLDAVLGFYVPEAMTPLVVDDAVDPDTGMLALDPSLELTMLGSGLATLVVGSYPDLDFDGADGATTGEYWLRVEVLPDSDADGIIDEHDVCHLDAGDDEDSDGFCADQDNCPSIANQAQDNGDLDSHGDVCDNCPGADNEGQEDGDSDDIGDVCDPFPLDPANDLDGDGYPAGMDNCPNIYNPSQDESAKLNDPLASGGAVLQFDISPDGLFAVYRADQETAYVDELFSAPIPDGGSTKLNDTLVADGDVLDFVIAPDSAWVIYTADQDTDQVVELYSVPIVGGARNKLSDAAMGGSSVKSFAVSPSGTHVVYIADHEQFGVDELYSVPIDGAENPVKLHGGLSFGSNVFEFAIAPDSDRVIFMGDLEHDGIVELFASPITVGAAVKLNGPLVAGGSVRGFLVSPHSFWIVYFADQDTDEVVELYSADTFGGGRMKISPALVTGGDVTQFRISDDGASVVYMADQDTDEVVELYVTPIDDVDPHKLSAPLVSGGDVWEFQIGFGSFSVVYMADQETDNVAELYHVPLNVGGVTKISGTLAPGGDVTTHWEIGPWGEFVTFVAEKDAVDVYGLYSVPTDGSAAPTTLSPSIPNLEASTWFRISPDHWTVLYLGYAAGFTLELRSVSILGGASRVLNGPLTSGGDVTENYAMNLNTSRWAVYRADEETDDVVELFAALVSTDRDLDGILDDCDNCILDANPLQGDVDSDGDGDACDNCVDVPNDGQADGDSDGLGNVCDNCPLDENPGQFDEDSDGDGDACDPCLGDPANDADEDGYCEGSDSCPGTTNTDQLGERILNNPLVAGGDVLDFEIASSGARVVYLADQQVDQQKELHSVPLGGGTVVRLNDALPAGGWVQQFAVSPDASRVVYQADQALDDKQEIFSVSILGGATTRLNPVMANDRDTLGFLMDPTSTRVVYGSNHEGTKAFYSVLIGGGASTRISGDLTQPAGSGEGISSDGSMVVFTRWTGPTYELYSAPIAGGSVTLLNDPLVAGGEIQSYKTLISPDGAWVVYFADQDTDEVVEIYSVPIGGGTVNKLNGPLVAGGDVETGQVRFSPDSSRVIFGADAATDGIIELYSAPIGGGSPVKLNGVLPDGQEVIAWELSDDGGSVVYVANQDGTAQHVYSVPIAGGPATRISGDMVAGGAAHGAFRISPDSSTVVYAAYQDQPEVLELYAAPIGGGGGVVKLSEPMVAGGGIQVPGSQTGSLLISPDGSHVIYTADQELDQRTEAYSVPITGGRAIKLNRDLVNGGDVWAGAEIDFYSSMAVYLCDWETDGIYELFSVPLDRGSDDDSDGFLNGCDPCPAAGGHDLADADLDGWGDSCDNCPVLPNADQADADSDGEGDICQTDDTEAQVTAVFPPQGSVDVALATSVTVYMSEPVDPATANTASVFIDAGGIKVPGRLLLSADGMVLSLDPLTKLPVNVTIGVHVTPGLRDLAGNPTWPFSSSFDTANQATSGTLPTADIGTEHAGATVPGANANDNAGFSNAVVGDVNADGIADLVIGAPNADVGANADVGTAQLVFGAVGLQSNATVGVGLVYEGVAAGQHAGTGVARGGDLSGDGVADFVVAAPNSTFNGADSGAVYLVFGNAGLDELAPADLSLGGLATCNNATLCGVIFHGEAAGDLAGASASFAGDLNNDGEDDLLIGAPGASPGGRSGAGKVYLVYGPLSNGTIQLSTVGSTTPGLVFHGESAGDLAGGAVSWWEHPGSNAIDDFLVGAPGAATLDEFGAPVAEAGYVYAIHGGTLNLDDKAVGGVVELSRVADGTPTQVHGTVFLGTIPGGKIGRTLTGAVDIDGDGVPDVIIGADGVAWVIPGDDPKTTTGAVPLEPKKKKSVTPVGTLSRSVGEADAVTAFDAWYFTTGDAGDLGELVVGGAGDVNNDGFEDYVVGAPAADLPSLPGAGKAYVIYGGPVQEPGEHWLSDVGGTEAGLVVEGHEAGDHCGQSVDGGFDVNADGVDDALVGAPFADSLPTTPTDAGESYVISPLKPDEVVALRVGPSAMTPGTTELEWSVPDLGMKYNVYRGDLAVARLAGEVRTSSMATLACRTDSDGDSDGLPDTTDGDPLPAGSAYFYLVTGVNSTGEGPLGPQGLQPPRILDAQCP